jgi:NAD(P)-dependent dehydrogenase (short-subunit alcohol dehydrogenase family)
VSEGQVLEVEKPGSWDLSLAGGAYIVTGAGSGIGKATALVLAELGAGVVAVDIDDDALAAVASVSESIVPLAGDCAGEDVARQAVREADRAFGCLSGLVANVGIAVTARIEELELDEWTKSLAVNLTSHFLATRETLRHLVAQGRGGAIVYVASKNAYSPGAGFGAYSVAKAGMVQLARIVALEGAEAGIRTNIVCPDAVFEDSRLWSDEIKSMRAREHGVKPAELEAFYQQRNLLRTRILPRDVARSIAFLLSPWSDKTTGCVITVDGGLPGVFPR